MVITANYAAVSLSALKRIELHHDLSPYRTLRVSSFLKCAVQCHVLYNVTGVGGATGVSQMDSSVQGGPIHLLTVDLESLMNRAESQLTYVPTEALTSG